MKTVTKIEAAEPTVRREERVAAYCRVSTAITEQKESLQAQREHFEQVIAQRRDWIFAGIYSDEGISGTKKETRPALQRLLQDCENGLIDRIVTKSLSRFARNTADCLEMVRHLLDLGIPIYFEKEHLDTGRMENEFLLTLLGGLAEDESRSMSKNIKWSIQRRMENGTYRSVTPYGYRQDKDGWHIVEEEARWVRYMFEQAANGVNFQTIAESLNAQGVKAPRRKPWTNDTLLYLLKNEKYIGDCRLQKSYMDSDFHRCVNRGEEAQYYVEDHHEPIVSRETFQAVQRVIALRSTKRKAGKVGYIPQKNIPVHGQDCLRPVRGAVQAPRPFGRGAELRRLGVLDAPQRQGGLHAEIPAGRPHRAGVHDDDEQIDFRARSCARHALAEFAERDVQRDAGAHPSAR